MIDLPCALVARCLFVLQLFCGIQRETIDQPERTASRVVLLRGCVAFVRRIFSIHLRRLVYLTLLTAYSME
eukprot:6284169-Prymnesium_polylepis.2